MESGHLEVEVRRKRSAKSASHQDVEDVLREAVARVVDEPGTAPPTTPGGVEHNDLLEVVVDGLRYMLIPYPVQAPVAPINLSPREQEIVRLVARGLPNKAIAAVLEISCWTVATHLRRIFAKLEVNSRAEMVARTLQAGLVPSNNRDARSP